MRVAVITNPVHRQSPRMVSLLRDACRERGWREPLVERTTLAQPGAAQTRRCLAAGVDRIVVCGGDGTVRDVATALAETSVPLGVVSTGTANLFARNLRLPVARSKQAIATALDTTPWRVDLGEADLLRPGGRETHVFLVVIGLGFDADTVAATKAGLKRRIAWAAYFEPALTRLARKPRPVDIRIDDEPELQTRAWSVLVGSSGRIPWGIDLFPDAAIDDGILDVALVAPPSVAHWAGIGLKGALKFERDVPGLHYRQAHAVTITPVKPSTVQIDGDPFDHVERVDVRIRPQVLTVAAEPPAARVAGELPPVAVDEPGRG